MRSRLSQPDWVAGSVLTMISSMPCSATASLAAFSGSESPTSPEPSRPASRMKATARSTRTCAESRTTSS